MATTDHTHDQSAYNRLKSLPYTSGWAERLYPVIALGGYGALIAMMIAITTLMTITIAPIAGSALGTAGLLGGWLIGIGLICATPALARRCLAASRLTP